MNIIISPYAYVKLRIKKNSTSLNVANARINSTDVGAVYVNYPHIYDTILPEVHTAFGNDINNIWRYIYFYPAVYPDHTANKEDVYIKKGDTLTYLIEFN